MDTGALFPGGGFAQWVPAVASCLWKGKVKEGNGCYSCFVNPGTGPPHTFFGSLAPRGVYRAGFIGLSVLCPRSELCADTYSFIWGFIQSPYPLRTQGGKKRQASAPLCGLSALRFACQVAFKESPCTNSPALEQRAGRIGEHWEQAVLRGLKISTACSTSPEQTFSGSALALCCPEALSFGHGTG